MSNLWGDSLSGFWSAWIIIITLGTIALSVWILLANRRTDKTPDAEGNVETTGHAADGIEEYDNPLPKWWFQLFVLTVVFALGYLVLYPGLGNYAGVLGWSQEGQWEEEVAQAEERFTPILPSMRKYLFLSLLKIPMQCRWPNAFSRITARYATARMHKVATAF